MEYAKIYKTSVNSGFTLAELLVTITIIGIIASLSIPGLINSVQEQQYAAGLKKYYAVLSEATIKLQNDYGTINTSSYINMKNDYKKVLVYVKEADSLDTTIYPRYVSYYKGAYGADNGTQPTILVLSDGTILLFWGVDGTCSTSGGSITTYCGSIAVDLNGIKPPNMIGKDYFEFILHKPNGTYTILPEGSQTSASCVAGSSSWATSLGCAQNVLTGTPLP